MYIDQSNTPVFCVTCKKLHVWGECEYEGMCQWCLKREAVLHFGDMLSFTHGGGDNCCRLCAVKMQLDHARERAKAIPELEEEYAQLAELEDDRPQRNARD